MPEKPILQGFRRSVTSAKVHYIPDVSGYAAKLKIKRPQSVPVRVRPSAPILQGRDHLIALSNQVVSFLTSICHSEQNGNTSCVQRKNLLV